MFVLVMMNYKVVPFKTKGGETDDSKRAIKVARRTLHPGVVGTMIGEVTPVISYHKGPYYHIWVVSAEGATAFTAMVSGTAPEALAEKMAVLRATFPASPPAPVEEVDDEGDEGEDESEGEDEESDSEGETDNVNYDD